MAIAYVSGNYGATDSSVSELSATAFSATTGNAIVVWVANIDNGSARTISGVSDTAGNSYARCGTAQQIDLGGGYYGIIDIWIAHNITGHATNAVKATFSGAADSASRIIALEFSGMHLTAAHDTGYAPAYNLDDTSPHTTTAASTAEAGEMVVGFFWDVYDPTASVGAYSSSSPSVVRINAVIGGSIASATNLVGSAGSYSVAVAATSTEHHWCYAKAFKQAAAGGNKATKFAKPAAIMRGMIRHMWDDVTWDKPIGGV